METKERSDQLRKEMGFAVNRIIDAAENAHYLMYDPRGEIVVIPNTNLIVSGDTHEEAWERAPELTMEHVMMSIHVFESGNGNNTRFDFAATGEDEIKSDIYVFDKDYNLTSNFYGEGKTHKCALFAAAIEYFRDRRESLIVHKRHEEMKDAIALVVTSADDVLEMFDDDDNSTLE